MVSKLQTRCSVLAATNPKGQYDQNMTLSVNTAIASPLLSRFDLVLVLLDSRNPEWDESVSSYILQQNIKQEEETQGEDKTSPYWSIAKLQAYFSYIRTLKPQLTPESNRILSSYYRRQRRTDGADAARTTVRLLQSCVRLAQGHARLMARSEVTVQDAVTAVLLLESSSSSSSLVPGQGNVLHSALPADPVAEYAAQARQVLGALELPELLQQEVARLAALRRDGAGGEETRERMTASSASSSAQPDYTQVLREIQKNKAAVIPPAEVRKRKRRKKQSKISKCLKVPDDDDKDAPDDVARVRDGSESEESDNCGDLGPTPPSDPSSTAPPSVPPSAPPPDLCSTLLHSPGSRQPELRADLSPIAKDNGSNASPPTLIERPSLSEKTRAKLDVFKRLDNEEGSSSKIDPNKRSAMKSAVKSSLLALGAKIKKSNEGNEKSNKKKLLPLNENEDFDFEFDL